MVDLVKRLREEVNNCCAQTGQRTADRDSIIDLMQEIFPESESDLEWLRQTLPDRINSRPVAVE